MSERAHIVTLYNSLNAGAYLQALALGLYLGGAYGLDCSYIDTGARSPMRTLAKNMKDDARNLQADKAVFDVERVRAYGRALTAFASEPVRERYDSNDLLVFGSDEIWNTARKRVWRYPALWGGEFDGGYRVAYAPSANGADLTASPVADSLIAGLRRFSFLSARDQYTADSVSRFVNADVPVVCDPTLLLDADTYRALQDNPPEGDYVLVYAYETKMEPDAIEEIRRYAHGMGAKLISADRWLPWCDECLPCGPFGFLGLVDGAKAVITDTFHGTVFSTIYRKQFASYVRGNAKIADILEQTGLSARDPRACGSLEGCLAEPVDYSSAEHAILAARASSASYLDRVIGAWRSDGSGPDAARACGGSIEVRKDASLREMTTVKVGGSAERLWVPHAGDDLALLPRKADGTYRILSAGSNLLITDEHPLPDVVYMGEFDDTVEHLGSGVFRVGASVRIQKLIKEANALGYGGLEALVSVPGLIGGLICMNASVPSAGTCISDYLESVEAFDGERCRTMGREECAFGYRSSRFQDGRMIILSARFRLPEQDAETSRELIRARKERCARLQDHSGPNFGSVFCVRNARIMTAVRRLGLAHGGFAFSKKTGNWLVNAGGGSFADAVSLIRGAEGLHRMAGEPCLREVRVWE